MSSQEAPPGPPAQQRQALPGLTLKPKVTSGPPHVLFTQQVVGGQERS